MASTSRAAESRIELVRSPSARKPPRTASILLKKRFPGFFGITYRNWGYILGLFALLYSGFGLYFWGLIEVALQVRDDRYLVLPKEWYGNFAKDIWPAFPKTYSSYPVGHQVPWNNTLF